MIENHKYKSTIWLAVYIALIQICQTIGFIHFKVNYVLIVLPLIFLIIYNLSSVSKVNFVYILYLIYIPLNILITDPPYVFRSWERYALFAIALLSYAPILENARLRCFRYYCLQFFLLGCIPLVVGSFFCYFLGINYFTAYSGPEINYIEKVSTFGGLFKQSMILGPVSALVSCTLLWKFLNSRKKIWLLILFICIGATLLSASRSAVAGMTIGLTVLLYTNFKNKSKGLKYLIVTVLILGCTYPIWEGATDRIMKKHENNQNYGAYDSRTTKFNARFDEISKDPVFGVGFASIDPQGRDEYNPTSGTVEPGSSWLGVMSMTGIIGLAFFLYFVINAFKCSLKSNRKYAPLLCSLISFFIFHLMFEGYALAGGSFLCFIFWLIIGVSSDLKYPENIKASDNYLNMHRNLLIVN